MTLTAESQTDRPHGLNVKRLNVALQGGGAHGAFAWGVLDRLLEDDTIEVDGISAASAGAMNATVFASGLVVGGRVGARRALEQFWRRVSHAAAYGALQPSLWDRWTHNHSLETSPVYVAYDLLTRLFSPYQFNPTNRNPLRRVLEDCVDFERLRRSGEVKLFLTATNVLTGKARVFQKEEITPEAVLASACLPFLFHAVEIDGEAYWDGGYMGNPALYPLIYHTDTRDVLIVHINPLTREAAPRLAHEILNRMNEISFNSSLMRELRVIAFVSQLIEDGTIPADRMKAMLIHAIADDEFMRTLSVSSKLNADWEFLLHLRDRGRLAADAWIQAHSDAIGERSTIDFATYL